MMLKIQCVLVCLASVTHFAYSGDEIAAAKITEITLTRSGNSDGTGPEDEDGKSVAVLGPPPEDRLWLQVKYSLNPDEELTIASPQIAFVSSVHGNVIIPTVLAKPGKYKIGFEGTGKVEVEIAPRAP